MESPGNATPVRSSIRFADKFSQERYGNPEKVRGETASSCVRRRFSSLNCGRLANASSRSVDERVLPQNYSRENFQSRPHLLSYVGNPVAIKMEVPEVSQIRKGAIRQCRDAGYDRAATLAAPKDPERLPRVGLRSGSTKNKGRRSDGSPPIASGTAVRPVDLKTQLLQVDEPAEPPSPGSCRGDSVPAAIRSGSAGQKSRRHPTP